MQLWVSGQFLDLPPHVEDENNGSYVVGVLGVALADGGAVLGSQQKVMTTFIIVCKELFSIPLLQLMVH